MQAVAVIVHIDDTKEQQRMDEKNIENSIVNRKNRRRIRKREQAERVVIEKKKVHEYCERHR